MEYIASAENKNNNLPLKAKVYSGRFLCTGSMPYEESNEIINIPNQKSLENIAKTHIGIPVIIEHKDITPYNLKNEIVGRVSRVYINNEGFTDANQKYYPADGWAWCDFVVENAKAIELLDKEGWELSNSYVPVEKLSNNPNYDKDIIGGEGLHLAIVEKGRYNTKIARLNSKPKINNNNFFNKPMDILKKIKEAISGIEKEYKIPNTVSNNSESSESSKIPENEEKTLKENIYKNKYFMHNGEKILVEEVINALIEHKKESTENEICLDNEYDIDGEKMTGYDMLKHYENIKNSKKNESVDKKEFDEIQKLEEATESLEELEIKEQIEKITKKDNSKPFYKNAKTLDNSNPSLDNERSKFIKTAPKEEKSKSISIQLNSKDFINSQFN